MTAATPRSRPLLPLQIARLVLLLFIYEFDSSVCAFSASSFGQLDSKSAPSKPLEPVGNVLILDHLNINHQQGRHDWLKTFYFDFLGCSIDPRKAENLEKGSKTLWANVGAQQFHLPEGAPDAQVLDGYVTLVYPNLNGLKERYEQVQEALKGSLFEVVESNETAMKVIDPWGTEFRLVVDSNYSRDDRGTQPGGDATEGLGMSDLVIYTPKDADMNGIARFYEQVLGAPILTDQSDDSKCVVSVGPQQTLTFVSSDRSDVSHDDLRQEKHEVPDGQLAFVSNYGPHVSMYVANLAETYKRAEEVGVTYVNPRFKRRAYTLEEALDQCMFRCLNIVDPQNVEAGPILALEHEIRSVVKTDGTKYKSCPFDKIPDSCSS